MRFVDQLARQGAFAKQLLAAVEELLRGVERFLRRVDIALRFGDLLGHGGRGGRVVVRLGLCELAAAFLRRRDEVAVLELREQLTRLHVIAAVDQEAPHRRADLRHDVRLIAREEHRVGVDDQPDAPFDRRRHLHRRDGLGRFLRAMACHE